jgi:hypothetical protein
MGVGRILIDYNFPRIFINDNSIPEILVAETGGGFCLSSFSSAS